MITANVVFCVVCVVDVDELTSRTDDIYEIHPLSDTSLINNRQMKIYRCGK